jgi:hypothetical protein
MDENYFKVINKGTDYLSKFFFSSSKTENLKPEACCTKQPSCAVFPVQRPEIQISAYRASTGKKFCSTAYHKSYQKPVLTVSLHHDINIL